MKNIMAISTVMVEDLPKGIVYRIDYQGQKEMFAVFDKKSGLLQVADNGHASLAQINAAVVHSGVK